ncbi:MAG: HAD-IA family hydrolase [Lachnospiraceae bacterium]|nr:HAD-IA family hydrolase [Lachnospiraceae bacterium]
MVDGSTYAFIWDMDGTLIDSYGAIVSSVRDTYAASGIETDTDEIRRITMKYSVSAYLEIMEKRTGKPFSEMSGIYSRISEANNKEIGLIENAGEILKALNEKGYKNFVFTHRGASTDEILKRCGVTGYFTEIVTKMNGFPRKPEPDAIDYLVGKYSLVKEKTFYVGDRSLDMECAANAGIGGILYRPEGSYTDPVGTEQFIVGDLMEILGCIP